jgi:hypothetical protein
MINNSERKREIVKQSKNTNPKQDKSTRLYYQSNCPHENARKDNKEKLVRKEIVPSGDQPKP